MIQDDADTEAIRKQVAETLEISEDDIVVVPVPDDDDAGNDKDKKQP